MSAPSLHQVTTLPRGTERRALRGRNAVFAGEVGGDGENGFHVADVQAMAEATEPLEKVDAARCRRSVASIDLTPRCVARTPILQPAS